MTKFLIRRGKGEGAIMPLTIIIFPAKKGGGGLNSLFCYGLMVRSNLAKKVRKNPINLCTYIKLIVQSIYN